MEKEALSVIERSFVIISKVSPNPLFVDWLVEVVSSVSLV